MVGVKLSHSWTKTRQLNGNALQTKINVTTGSSRTGKFMPYTCRPFSINNYASSKIWFKSHTVNLRETDYKNMNSSLKKWLYADQFIKPEESVLYRSPTQGGLGLINIKLKSKACLLRTFLELAINPKYLHSLYHSNMFRFSS